MSIRFHHKRRRLHVGYRASDWSDVWMEQKAELENYDNEDETRDDGETNYDLYRFSTGGRGRREPMNDEVKWHQHFDPKNCDATTAAGRKKLQKRFLHDAFQYLTAKDAAQAWAMERDLDKPREARWQSWFDMAKKYKRRQMPDLRRAGGPDDDDDDDSAYDSDEDNEGGSGGPMPPPRRPANPRRRPGPEHGGQNKRPKAKQEGETQQIRLSFARGPSYHTMSGGLGPRSDRSGSVTRDRGDDFDDVNGNDIYDPSPPEGVENVEDTINGNDLDNVGSPSGVRRRGSSRENSLPLCNAWNRSGDYGDNADSHQNSIRADIEAIRVMEELNGGVDEEKALRRAMRESVEPNGEL